MKTTLEVCIDNIESLTTAINAGADRIELCSSLALGGLTPSAGFAAIAIERSSIPVYPIIRHRAGDFVFDEDEIDIMVVDIERMKSLGASGVVVGALTPEGSINESALSRFMQAAQGIGVTFHRAFDMCAEPEAALEVLITHGCERLLTSGQHATALAGRELIRQLIDQAAGRISIMPGAGVNADNVKQILQDTGAFEIHLSGKTTRPGRMMARADVKMGDNSQDDSMVNITDFKTVRNISHIL